MAQPIDARFARQFLERLHAAVNAHDAEAVAALCAEDVVWEDPAAPEPLRGREAVYRFHRDMMFRSLPDVRIELVDGPHLSLDRAAVAARLRITGTMTGPMDPPGFAPTGEPVEFETAEFSHFDGELLARHTVVLNMLALARQIGAAPRAGSRAERVNVWLQRLAARRARRRWGQRRAERRGYYWRVIRPAGAFAAWQLLRAVRRKAEHAAPGAPSSRMPWRSVRVSQRERARVLPGDELIPQAIDTLTHGVTIRRPPRDVWPWLVQMGAGSRGGWYSYDWLDNGRKPSVTRIVPELQDPAVGTIFPVLPGVTDGFTVLAIERERLLVLGWLRPDGTPLVTWAFVLEEPMPGVTRLLVRARGGTNYRFHGLPLWLSRPMVWVVHFMQRKQLLGIATRAEGHTSAEVRPPAGGSREGQDAA